ncbi:MAG: glycosyltransferase family 2 protein [Cetobacterium sp.]|uniref:glycosyltransferase family 2 protein n=1 Tax=Cetobacterium sp. TaxID=2071632 RepID=UPI003F3569DD
MIKNKVSVIIPIYNVELYLKECLESVINQTLKEIEIILINDGSTDNSFNIIEKYKEKDERIKTINQKNQGQSIARNNGLDIATGEYIYFMDSDDLSELDTLKLCYEKSKKENLDFLIFDSKIFFDDIELEKKYKHFKKNREKNIEDKINNGINILETLFKTHKYSCSPCVHFISKKYLDKIGLKFYPKIIHEDELFFLKLYLPASRVNYIKKFFFKRRIRKNSTMTKKKSEKNLIGYLTVAKEMKRLLVSEKDTKKIELIKLRIRYIINSCISLLECLDRDKKIIYKDLIIKEFINYIFFKEKIKIFYPKIFKIIKVLKEKVV